MVEKVATYYSASSSVTKWMEVYRHGDVYTVIIYYTAVNRPAYGYRKIRNLSLTDVQEIVNDKGMGHHWSGVSLL